MIDVSTKQSRARFYGSADWKQIRQAVLARDHYECTWCKSQGMATTADVATLEVDHIQELEFHPELATDMDNLRTLCRDCHNKRHDRMNYRGEQKKKKWNDEKW